MCTLSFFFIVDALFYVANANITNLKGRCYMKIMSTHKLNWKKKMHVHTILTEWVLFHRKLIANNIYFSS